MPLNAAHASPDALANAAPDSRVGLLAVYLGIATTQDLTAKRDAAQAALDADPGNALLIAALVAAQADLDAALTLEANALFPATKDNDNIDTMDSEVIARVRALLGLPPI